MSYEETLRSVSLNADASLGIYTGVPGRPGSAVPNAGMQYRGVRVTGKDQVGLAVAAGDNLVGVLQNKPQEPGAAATVAFDGITNCVAGGPVGAGVEVTVDATGRFIAGATTGVGKRLISVGIAAGAGELFPAIFV